MAASVCRKERGRQGKAREKGNVATASRTHSHTALGTPRRPERTEGSYQFSTLETMTSPPYAREHFASLSEMGLGAKFNSYMFCLLIPSDAGTTLQFL